MATLKQRLHRKNGTSYDIIHLETDASVVYLSSTDNTTVADKITNIDEEMISVKTSVSEGKTLIASAITDKGVSTASDASFSTMADNISKIPSGISGVPIAGRDFTYSGEFQVIDDTDDKGAKWRIKFLSSGNFVPLSNMEIDAFYVGGGGGFYYYAGGGGGYTKTEKSLVLTANTEYPIVIGAGGVSVTANFSVTGNNGGDTSGFNLTANGGKFGTKVSASYCGGDGGSGGGGWVQNMGGDGGSDGSNAPGQSDLAGVGQGTTTREFGESTGDLYAGGGGGRGTKEIGLGGAGGGGNGGENGTPNTGGGGGGNNRKTGSVKTSGGSGIVIIRNHRE